MHYRKDAESGKTVTLTQVSSLEIAKSCNGDLKKYFLRKSSGRFPKKKVKKI